MRRPAIVTRSAWAAACLAVSAAATVTPLGPSRRGVHEGNVDAASAAAPWRAPATAGAAAATPPSDEATLRHLNERYIRAVQNSDVRWFSETLADDFMCSLSDGSHVDRRTFLKKVAAPATISSLQAHDVDVRILGDVAIIHARTTFKLSDGRPGASRYTDVWARRDGRWMAIAAHVTRY